MDLKDENYNSSNSNSEDNDEEIKCRCGQNVDSGSLMICCDKCEFWQHAECYFGITKQKMPETFYCHLCVPKQADMFKYIDNEDIRNELLNDWLEYAKKNKKKRKKKKNQEDYNFNTKEVAVLERYWKHYCRNAHNEELSENILRSVAIIFNCKVAIIHEVFYNMALDIQQLSSPSFIVGTDNKDPFSGWKLKNENIYTKVSDNITKPKEISDPNSLDNPLEDFMKVLKVEMWEEKKDQNDQWYLEYGVFTNRAIDQSQLIIEFYGKFTTWDAYRNLKGKLTKPNFRGLIFPEKGLCVDATKHGNVSRYLRRSCSPNAKVIEKWIDGKMRLGIFSTCKIEAGSEITIPFDYSYGSLRNGLECACTKEQCPVLLWYIDRKKLSDTFLECNKLETIVKEKEPKIVIEQQPIPKKKVIIDLQVDVAPTPIPHETRSRSKSRRNSSKMSREERKLQAIVQTIDRLEEQEKKKQSPLPNHLSQKTSLKTSTNSLAKKTLFPSNNNNFRESSPKAQSNLLNKKPLGHSSQNVNGSILNSSKSPSSNNSSSSRTTPPKGQIKKELKESSEVVLPKMVGKKAWMTKYLTEENESKSEEANQSPLQGSPSSSPIDSTQNTIIENNNNVVQFKQEEIHENIIISINNTNTNPSINNNNNNNNEKIENNNVIQKNDNININTVNNNNNNNTHHSFQIHSIQIQPSKNELIPPPIFKFHTHPSQSTIYVPPPINDPIQENGTGSTNKRKLEESNGSHQHFITETLSNNNNNNLILNNPVTLPLPPNSPPASPPDIGPELPPDPKKRRNSNNGTDNLVNSHQNEAKSNDNILPPINDAPPSTHTPHIQQESYSKDNPNLVHINGNNGNSFINLNGNGYVDRQPKGIYNNNPSQGNNNFPIDSIRNN